MYQPTVHNAFGVSSSWVSGNHYQMADQTFQYSLPTGMHRCISTPYLGTGYGYPTSPPDLKHGVMPPYSQAYYHMNSHIHGPPEMYAYHCQPNVLPDFPYKGGNATHSSAAVCSQQVREVNVGDYQQQMKSESKNCCKEREKKFEENHAEKCATNEYYYQLDKHIKDEPREDFSMYCQCKHGVFLHPAGGKNMKLDVESEIPVCENEKNDLKHEMKRKVENRKIQKKLTEKDAIAENLKFKMMDLQLNLERKRIKSLPFDDQFRRGDAGLLVQDLFAENEELIVQLGKTKDDLDRETATKVQLVQKYRMENLELKAKLANEKEFVVALTEDNKMKDDKIDMLKKQLKEVAAQKQSLVEEQGELRKHVKNFTEESAAAEGRKTLERKLLKEMFAAVGQIKNLAEFCTKVNHGEDMSISLILGTHAQPLPGSAIENYSAWDDMLSCQIKEVKKIQDDVRKLQEMLSTSYAIRLGSQLSL